MRVDRFSTLVTNKRFACEFHLHHQDLAIIANGIALDVGVNTSAVQPVLTVVDRVWRYCAVELEWAFVQVVARADLARVGGAHPVC